MGFLLVAAGVILVNVAGVSALGGEWLYAIPAGAAAAWCLVRAATHGI